MDLFLFFVWVRVLDCRNSSGLLRAPGFAPWWTLVNVLAFNLWLILAWMELLLLVDGRPWTRFNKLLLLHYDDVI